VRIPSGDLVPPRRRGLRRRPGRSSRPGSYGGSYGASGHRRGRRSRTLPLLLVVVLVGGVAGGLQLWRSGPGGEGERLRAAACPPSGPVAADPSVADAPAAAPPAVQLPEPAAVGLLLLNGTGRDGLARTVADGLAARGFAVLGTGNAPEPVTGPPQVSFGPGGRPGATLLTAHLPGAELVPVPSAPRGSVQVVLGDGYTDLAAPDAAAAEVQRLTSPPSAAPAPAAPAPAGPAPAAAPPAPSGTPADGC
jgi:hypothetical protein